MSSLEKLDEYLHAYTDFNDWLIKRRYRHFRELFRGKRCLELGVAKGAGIDTLLDAFETVTVVDGSSSAIENVRQRYTDRSLQSVEAAFEDVDLGNARFDTILLAHILEHVDDPVRVLRHVSQYVAPDGIFIIDVPNAYSIHRRVGVKMGLLSECSQLNAADLSIGHQRVYTPDTLRRDVCEAGLEIQEFGGMFIKVTSGAQTEEVFREDQLEAFFEVGLELPELAAEIFVVATVP